MSKSTKNSNALYEMVALRVKGLTDLDLEAIDELMGSTIWSVVNDENAQDFAYGLMAEVVVKRYKEAQAEIIASEASFRASVNAYWMKQLNA